MEYLKNLTKPELILVKVKELKPNPENPNRHSPEQINALANVFKYQGLRKPIIVSNQSGMIVTGHGTLEAIMQNGWEHAIIVKQDFDSYEQEYAHMVADNSLSNRSELDYAAINEKIIDLGPDFNIEMLGLKNFLLDPKQKSEWESNSDIVNKTEENLNGITSTIKIKCPQELYDEVLIYIKAKILETSFTGVEVV